MDGPLSLQAARREVQVSVALARHLTGKGYRPMRKLEVGLSVQPHRMFIYQRCTVSLACAWV